MCVMSTVLLRVRSLLLGILPFAFCCSAIYAQRVSATLNAGTTPQAIAVNSVTNKIYVANRQFFSAASGSRARHPLHAQGAVFLQSLPRQSRKLRKYAAFECLVQLDKIESLEIQTES
jgi:hypothetical protein